MEIDIQHWTEVRSLKRPELTMLSKNGLIQTCTAKRKNDAIGAASLPKLVCFDRSYVENYFLQYFYEILVQEFLTASRLSEPLEADANQDARKTVTVKSVIAEAIDGFVNYLDEIPSDKLKEDSLELYRAYRKWVFTP